MTMKDVKYLSKIKKEIHKTWKKNVYKKFESYQHLHNMCNKV